jgi:octaprenyl-diphosphate synthase
MKTLNTFLEPINEYLVEMERCMKQIREKDSSSLSEILDYTLDRGGKRIRPAMTFLAGKFYSDDLVPLVPMATSVELLHTATLIHDDIIDKSVIRHGRSTVNDIWGENRAIILGDYLFAKAGELCAAIGNAHVVQLFNRTLAMMSIGEMNQSFEAFKAEQTRERYFDRINKKTASLFILATESGAILSCAPEQSVEILREYGHNLGIAFQIVDDILDVIGNEQELGKPVGSDLSQGIFTLPVLLFKERYPEETVLQRVFESDGGQDDVRQVIDMINNSMIIKECYDIVAYYRDMACRDIDLLPDCVSCRALNDIAYYLVQRRI